ncbi:MAG: N-formylglutamate amidohydrolase [Deltaproteobacteria bacterium]|nr:N-formylglutamate amidohydrolase [Deltaproteobacteria bacterium]
MPLGLVLSCEHAAWQLPPGDDLGVTGEDLRSQAGWDPGALAIALEVGEALAVPVHAGAFSRMFVDLNRPPDHVDVIPRVSYGAPVPGNAALSADERARRLTWFHAPYWDAVRTDARARLVDHDGCLHLCSHSFDPALDPDARRFEVGVLYDPDHAFEAALSERLLFGLRKAGIDVRANQPYRGTGPSIATSLRAELGARYGGIQLETSHAVVDRPEGALRIGRAVAAVVGELLAREP